MEGETSQGDMRDAPGAGLGGRCLGDSGAELSLGARRAGISGRMQAGFGVGSEGGVPGRELRQEHVCVSLQTKYRSPGATQIRRRGTTRKPCHEEAATSSQDKQNGQLGPLEGSRIRRPVTIPLGVRTWPHFYSYQYTERPFHNHQHVQGNEPCSPCPCPGLTDAPLPQGAAPWRAPRPQSRLEKDHRVRSLEARGPCILGAYQYTF